MESDLKKIGYAFLGLGVIMILGAVIQMIFVFTSVIDPVGLFSFKNSDFAIDASTLFPQLPSDLTKGLKVEILPAELINKALNLSMNTVLMSIIMLAGSKVASIGVNLLRPVYVKMPLKNSNG